MYWLCFYNSAEKPEIECAFLCDFMVVEYAEKVLLSDYHNYTVFTPHGGVVYLNKFISDFKEGNR